MTETTTPHRAEPPDGAGRVEFTITGVDRAALRRGVADALRLYDPSAEGWTVVMHITGETPDGAWPTRTLIPETWSADVSALATPPPQGYTGAPLVLEDDYRVWSVVGLPARLLGVEAVYIETGCRACPEGHRPHDRWLVVADEWAETRDGLPTRIVVYPWNDAHVAPADVDVVRAALTDLRPGAAERDTTPATLTPEVHAAVSALVAAAAAAHVALAPDRGTKAGRSGRGLLDAEARRGLGEAIRRVREVFPTVREVTGGRVWNRPIDPEPERPFHPADPYAPGYVRPLLEQAERPNPSRTTEPAPVERSPFWRRWRWRP